MLLRLYLSALILSTILPAQALAKSDSRYAFCTWRAESLYVGRIYLQALVLEELLKLGFQFQLFLAARFCRIVGSLLHRGLLLGRKAIPDLLGDGEIVEVDEMAGQHDLLW